MRDMSGGAVVVTVALLILILALALLLSTGLVFLVWNYLVVWAFPSMPLVTWAQAAVVAVVMALFMPKNIKTK